MNPFSLSVSLSEFTKCWIVFLFEILPLHCNVVYSWNVGYYFCLKIFWIVSSLKEFRPSIGWSKYYIFFFLLCLDQGEKTRSICGGLLSLGSWLFEINGQILCTKRSCCTTHTDFKWGLHKFVNLDWWYLLALNLLQCEGKVLMVVVVDLKLSNNINLNSQMF